MFHKKAENCSTKTITNFSTKKQQIVGQKTANYSTKNNKKLFGQKKQFYMIGLDKRDQNTNRTVSHLPITASYNLKSLNFQTISNETLSNRIKSRAIKFFHR
jgi:hypothetical protein